MPAIFSEPPGQPELFYSTAYPANLLARCRRKVMRTASN